MYMCDSYWHKKNIIFSYLLLFTTLFRSVPTLAFSLGSIHIKLIPMYNSGGGAHPAKPRDELNRFCAYKNI